jgi:hypothetical protein
MSSLKNARRALANAERAAKKAHKALRDANRAYDAQVKGLNVTDRYFKALEVHAAMDALTRAAWSADQAVAEAKLAVWRLSPAEVL